MAGIATAVRDALVQSRDPDYIYNWAMVANNVRLEAANGGKLFPLSSHENHLLVNSHTRSVAQLLFQSDPNRSCYFHVRIDWCSAHFGCPSGVRLYGSNTGKFFLRCFKPNPMKGVDGVWRVPQSVEITIGVPAELKPKLLETLSQGVRYMLDNEL